jgi:hypothetical protein
MKHPIPTHDPQTGEMNPYYEELTGEKNPLKSSADRPKTYVLRHIRRWWRYTWIRNTYRDVKYGVKNIWNWLPVIWKDRDYDQHYIYSVLVHKLEKQAIFIHHNGNHVDAKRDAEKMMLCARLARMQQDEMYVDEYRDTFELKCEFVPTDETKQWFTMETEIVSENFIDYFAKYQRQYRLLDKMGLDKDEIARQIGYKNQKRSRKLLFKILEENIERWWD